MFLNLLVVWGLTGIWHGANWTFLIWGLMFFCLISIEKQFDITKKLGFFSHVYTMFFVILGWVIFYSNSLSQALQYIKRMFFLTTEPFIDVETLEYLKSEGFFVILGIICATTIIPDIKHVLPQKISSILTLVCIAIALIISISYIIVGTYSPFIYFNF